MQQKAKSYFLSETVPVHKDVFEMLSHAGLAEVGGRLRVLPALHPAARPDLLILAQPCLLRPQEEALSECAGMRFQSSLKPRMSGDLGSASHWGRSEPLSELFWKKGWGDLSILSSLCPPKCLEEQELENIWGRRMEVERKGEQEGRV